MIRVQLVGRNIHRDPVLNAFRSVDRKAFVPPEMKDLAYQDRPLSIGSGQTISQPFIVAYMVQALDLKPWEKVLEIGSGCGYNAAIMARLAKLVCSVEVFPELAKMARENLRQSEIHNALVKQDDGRKGWQEKAPFDAIVLTAAPEKVPKSLFKQLTTGGRLLAPVGSKVQYLKLFTSTAYGFKEQELLPVKFVPFL